MGHERKKEEGKGIKKELRMEFFYRQLRRQTGLLMDGKNPVGGKWNFDAENRKKLPKGLAAPALNLSARFHNTTGFRSGGPSLPRSLR